MRCKACDALDDSRNIPPGFEAYRTKSSHLRSEGGLCCVEDISNLEPLQGAAWYGHGKQGVKKKCYRSSRAVCHTTGKISLRYPMWNLW